MNNSYNHSTLSILDGNVQELLAMDKISLQRAFLEDVSLLGEIESNCGEVLINKLIKFIPVVGHDNVNSNDVDLGLFIDLFSTPGLFDIDYVRDYLNNLCRNVKNLNSKEVLLTKIFMLYNNHTEEEIRKFNYIFKSSSSMTELRYGNNSLKELLNSRILSLFDKEDLSFIFRNNIEGFDIYNLYDLFSEENHKVLYMIAIMGKKVKSLIGRNQEFFSNVIAMIYEDKIPGFKKILVKFYDTFVGSKSDEKEFEELLLENDDIYEINDLMRSIMTYDGVNIFNNFKFFKKSVRKARVAGHNDIFKDGYEKKIKDGTFDITRDFKDIKDDVDFKSFKEAIVYNFYGIHLYQALDLVKAYGGFLVDLDSEVIDEDKGILSILKAIKNIVDLSMDDDLKINSLRVLYYEKMKDTDFNYMDKYYSPYMLKALFKRMIINTYNKNLLSVGDSLNLLDNDDGVLVYDSGNKFNMIFTALSGINNFYSDNFNMSNKWNTSFLATNNELCCSHICNSNLGVINLHSVLLGFDYIPKYSLQKMGLSDIYSNSKRHKKLFAKYFYPNGVNVRESRYGYNEILIDRFLTDDKDYVLKLQPSYVVCYKFDEEYKKTDVYKKCLKTANEFGIPIVLVDVKKVKEQEKKEISLMEEELFLSDKCNLSLMKDIVSRYMSNFTGALTMVGSLSIPYDEDFSVKGMKEFFDNVFSKINNLSLEDKECWLKSLEEVYYDEERKFKNAKRVIPYAYSVKEFGLNKYDLLNRIRFSRNNIGYTDNKRKQATIFVSRDGAVLSGYGTTTHEEKIQCGFNIEDINYQNSVIKISTNSSINSSPSLYDSFLRDEDYHPEVETIVSLIEYLHENSWCSFGSDIKVKGKFRIGDISGTIIERYETINMYDVLIENLVMSYFFESDKMLVDDMLCHDFDCDVSFKATDDFDFVSMINNSYSYKSFLDKNSTNYVPLIWQENVFELIDQMSNEDFLRIFSPVINNYCSKTGERFESVSCNLLDKKKNMREAFDSLSNSFNKEEMLEKRKSS